MINTITVGIAELDVARAPDVLITHSLGSCVGVCLLDPLIGLGGLAHILLPRSAELPNLPRTNKFADIAIPALIERMEQQGANRFRMRAKLAGGACMFTGSGYPAAPNIGSRNVLEAKAILVARGIPIAAEDTGSDYGRTLIFYPETGLMLIKSAIKGEREW